MIMKNILVPSWAFFIFGLVVAVCVSAQDTTPAVPKFIEETDSARIKNTYTGGWEFMVGGGVATFDCSGDKFPDMFLASGIGTSKFYKNISMAGGALKFVQQKSGLELRNVTGAYPLDIDSDGNMDLVVLRSGENVVMRGLGNCRFVKANKEWGFDGGDAWSVSFAAMWERGHNWPTMAVGNYIDRTQTEFPWGSCTDNWLHRPMENTKKFAEPFALKPSYCALSMLFSDWNRSGTPSLRVSNDREYYKGGQEQLWKILPNETPKLYSEAEGWKYLRIWGMGIASTDLNNDGLPEYFLTSMADSKLQTLANPSDAILKPSLNDVAFKKGVTAHRPYTGGDTRPSTGWHAQFEDVNNDGLEDLFIAKGNVAKMPDFAAQDPNNLLLQNQDGNFTEAGDKAGVASMFIGRGAMLTDFNLDGWPDVVVVNRWAKTQLWRNMGNTSGPKNHWLQLQLQQGGANKNAVGAWVEIQANNKIQRKEIVVGGGHASGSAGWIHFGLGEASAAKVRVQWPNTGPNGQAWSDWMDVQADGFAIVERDKPVTIWSPTHR